MNVSCPKCETTYRVDPAKVPARGVRARCTQCGELIRIDSPAAAATSSGGAAMESPAVGASGGQVATTAVAAEAAVAEAAPADAARGPSLTGGEASAERPARPVDVSADSLSGAVPVPPAAQPSVGARPAPAFGAADPDAKARRLARALVSDIVVYHPERRERSIAAGTLRQEFREEIQKSWEEYVGQVGDSLARGTPHFREALNEILAGGNRVF